MSTRREFLKYVAATSAGLLLPSAMVEAMADSQNDQDTSGYWTNQTRVIWLSRRETGEKKEICYAKDGQLDKGGYIQACRMLRDIHEIPEKQIVAMDIVLLDLLYASQRWLWANRFYEPLIVLSGYRSPRTNANTEHAAKNSYHMKGKAVDLRVPNIPATQLGNLLRMFNAGGIGYYNKQNFIHADTATKRVWYGHKKTRKG